MTIVIWNGQDTPEELKELPPGTYVLQPADPAELEKLADLVDLDDDQRAGLRVALDEHRRGDVVDHADVMREARSLLTP